MKYRIIQGARKLREIPAMAHISMVTNPRKTQAIGACLAVGAIFAPGLAEAGQAGGIGSWAVSIMNEAKDFVTAGLYLAYAGGVGMMGVGVSKGVAKSKGDQQVTTGSIFGYGVGGAILTGLTFFADAMVTGVSGGVAQKAGAGITR